MSLLNENQKNTKKKLKIMNITEDILQTDPMKRHQNLHLPYLYGRDIPSASIADAIVLAVYMPPQAPAPGHELRITFILCWSLMDPLTYSP